MRLRTLGAVLVACGLTLAVVPALIVRVADDLAARGQDAEVGQWLLVDTVAPARPTGVGVIQPGAQGYLLEIPRLGLRAVVRELEPDVFSGKNTPTLKRFGLGQVPYSAALRNVPPGAEGTAVIAGHRTTAGAPFRNLHRLGPGDVIRIRGANAEQRWTVVYSVTVAPHQVEAIRSEPGTRRLAIMACSPPFSDARRLIVYAAPASEGEN